MRRVSYVPIDAAKHRSSRSRVPGLRAGHSFMWSRPFPVFPAARHSRSTMAIFAEITARANNYNSCFDGPMSEKARAFADLSTSGSCFGGPAFVLLGTLARVLPDHAAFDEQIDSECLLDG